jgi:RND family efflux transporter MFP subunit
VSVKVDAFPDREFRGKVSIVFPSLEEKTRTLSIEALVPDKENLLKPGLFARVILYTGVMKDTVVVPNTALLYEGNQIRTYVVEDDKAKERPVKLGNKYGDEIEIVEGIKEGDKVIVAGQQGLSEGAKVSFQGAQRKDVKTRTEERPTKQR